jgi:competence protein ComGC
MSQEHTKFQRYWMRIIAKITLYLFVFGIIGLLFLILLPSFLNNPNKCCSPSSGRWAVAAIIRSQQAFFLDHGRFATSIDELNFKPDASTTEQYLFRLTLDNDNAASVSAIDKKSGSYNAFGRVETVKVKDGEIATQAILCTVTQPPKQVVFAPSNTKYCGYGTEKINRRN